MKRKIVAYTLAITAVLCFIGIDAEAKKPEIIRYDAQYLDRQVSLNLQWQSSETIVLVRVAAGKEVKEIKIDPYENKKTRSGYSGEVNVVLQADPIMRQDSISYTIQVEDEDGQKSNLVTGKVAIPASDPSRREQDQWGKDRLTGTPQSSQKDMIDQVRKVASVLAAPPVILDVAVNNPGFGTVTFKTKSTHSVGLREINFRVFDSYGKQVDSQQILATGKLWEGTSKDFTLSPGSYSVIAQAVDASGSTSRESKASFTIAGTATSAQPPVQPPVTQPVTTPVTPPVTPVTPPVQPPVEPSVTPPETPPAQPPETPPVQPPVELPVIPPVQPPVELPVTPPVSPSVQPPVTPPPAVTLPAGTELVTQPNLRDGLRGWTIQEWMKASDGKGEVISDSNGVTFRGTKENSRIGIMQSLNNLDVSTYGKIILTAQIRTEEQKLDGTGWQGREAPVGVFVTYTDVNGVVHNALPIMPSEPQTNRMFWESFYHVDPTGNSRNWHGTKVGKGQWYTYQYDLMTLNPRPKVLHYVGSEGAGWPTREGRIALLSLRGQTATPPPPPPIKELLTGTDLKGLQGWTIQEWMQPTARRGEVTENQDGIRFRSDAGNTRMGIMQTINADVSGAQKLILTAVIKAVEQRLDGTGWQGREAPVAIFVTYTDVSGVVRNGLGSMANPPESQANRMFWHGFYYLDPSGNSQSWNGTKVGQGSLYTYEVDLMSLNPKPKTILAVGAEGSGWSAREGKISSLSLKYYGTLPANK